MRRFGVLVALLLAAPLLAGCSTPGADAPEPAVDEGWPAPPIRTALPVELALSSAWVRPMETFAASATAVDGATYRWFLARDGPPVAASGESQEGEVPTLPGPAWRDVRLAAGAEPVEHAFALVGRHLLVAGEARLNVTVAPGGAADAEATLVRDAWGLRFVPDELTLSAGGWLRVQSAASGEHVLRLASYWYPLVAQGPAPAVVSAHQGALFVVVQAERADGARGEAFARLLVDPLKPDETLDFGERGGTIEVASASEPVRIVLRSEYAVRELRVEFSAASQLPGAPASVRVSLLAPDGSEAGTATGADGELVVEGLPRGEATLVVEGAEGALVDFVVHPVATLVLDAPARDMPTAGHEHGPVDPCPGLAAPERMC